MSLKEEAKKEYDEICAKEDNIKKQLKALQAEKRPLQEYLKSIGVIKRQKRSPQPQPGASAR